MKGRGYVLRCVIVFGLSIPGLSQQFQGSFTGAVTDASGAAVPGAIVTAIEKATGLSRSVATVKDGSYEVRLLPPAQYRLTAEARGFDKASEDPINLLVDQHAKVNFRLQVGTVTTELRVTAAPPILDTQNATTGAT